MTPSWLFVIALASVLSQESLSTEAVTPSPMVAGTTVKPGGAHNILSRKERTKRDHPYPSRSAMSGTKTLDRPRRQVGFFDPKNQQRPRNPNPKNHRGGGAISFPSDPPAWENKFNPPRPNRPPLPRPQQLPTWGQNPVAPTAPPNGNEFGFGNKPPIRTTRRTRVTPVTTRQPVTVDLPAVTRPTPASTRAGCNCPSTPEFNPVCGGDRVTYSNMGKLKCANYCGNPVTMVHLGSCITTTTTTQRPRPTPPSVVSARPPRPPTRDRNPPVWSWP